MKNWDEMTREEVLALGLVKAACEGTYEGNCKGCPMGNVPCQCELLVTPRRTASLTLRVMPPAVAKSQQGGKE